jgi:tetratricopeptide (TPR) repeat protein
MTQTTRTTLITLAVIIVVLLLGYFAWKERSSSAPAPTTTTSNATTTTATSTTVSASSTNTGKYTIKLVPSIKAPDYKAPLVFSKGITADQQAALQTQYATAVAAITKNPDDFNAWIMLGYVRKEAGDYEGAATDWQYMSDLAPSNPISFADLADLYTNFLPNYPKAAAAYKQEIKNNPTATYIYQDLYTLYTNQYPQSPAVIEAMLQAGITANPSAADLKATLAAYKAAHK